MFVFAFCIVCFSCVAVLLVQCLYYSALKAALRICYVIVTYCYNLIAQCIVHTAAFMLRCAALWELVCLRFYCPHCCCLRRFAMYIAFVGFAVFLYCPHCCVKNLSLGLAASVGACYKLLQFTCCAACVCVYNRAMQQKQTGYTNLGRPHVCCAVSLRNTVGTYSAVRSHSSAKNTKVRYCGNIQ